MTKAGRTVCGGMLLLLVLFVSIPAFAQTPRWIPIDDLADWSAEIFSGSPTVRWFLQGPKFEGAGRGIVAVDSQGTVYMACGTFIQEIRGNTARILTGAPGITGNSDGMPGQATFGNAIDIALASDELLYVVDAANFTLRKLERKHGIWFTSTIAGVPRKKGHADGHGREALFTNPFESLVVTEKGVVYLCDGDWLRKVENGVVTTLNAGHGYVNGPVKDACFARSQGRASGMAYDGQGNIYIADKVNMAIRKYDIAKGEVSTIAGVLPGVKKTRPRDGKAFDARFHPGGGPNIAFWNPIYKFLVVRSDDEAGIRAIKDGWVKTFGDVPGRRSRLEGPWKDVSGGAPCGVDRWGNVYVGMGRVTLRVKNRNSAPMPKPSGMIRIAKAAPPDLKWPEIPRGFGEVVSIAPRLSMGDAIPLPRGELLHQRHPALAYGNGVYLAVWQEGFNGLGHDSNIVGMRLSADGVPLDTHPMFICKAAGVQEAPAVAACGSGFLVAWTDYRMARDADIYATFIGANPRSRERQVVLHLARGMQGQAHPAVAFNGKDQALVVWQDYADGEGFSIRGTRIDVRQRKHLDPAGFEVMGRGEQPAVTWTGSRYLVCQKYYTALVDENGKVTAGTRVHPTATVYPSTLTTAWNKGHLFLSLVTGPDPWGWSGNGAVVGLRIDAEGRSMEAPVRGGLKPRLAMAADGLLPNAIDAARWANHHGWPMGMPGGFKSTQEGTWPSGQVAAVYNGRSLLVVWPRAELMDRRRLANRDLYLRRSYDGWAFVDKTKIKIAAGATEEANPVLCAGRDGDALLAYEKVEPRGVAIVYRIVRETPDNRGPRVDWTAAVSDTQMLVGFDEPIDPVSAANPAKYTIKGATVKGATVVKHGRAQQREVLLETAGMSRGKEYVIDVSDVKDRSGNANAAGGALSEFTFQPGAFERSRYIARWAVSGPFERYPAALPLDPAKIRPSPGKDGWKEARCSGGVVLDFRRSVAQMEGKSALANTYVYSTGERSVLLRVDSNDDNRVWLNGKLVGKDALPAGKGRGFHDYTNEYPTALRKGWNQLTIQVGNWIGQWQLAAQITDEHRQPIPDLTWQLDSP